jgi:hypothetical protein
MCVVPRMWCCIRWCTSIQQLQQQAAVCTCKCGTLEDTQPCAMQLHGVGHAHCCIAHVLTVPYCCTHAPTVVVTACIFEYTLQAFELMQQQGCTPDCVIYEAIIETLWDTGIKLAQGKALQLYRSGAAAGYVWHPHTQEPDDASHALLAMHSSSMLMVGLLCWLADLRYGVLLSSSGSCRHAFACINMHWHDIGVCRWQLLPLSVSVSICTCTMFTCCKCASLCMWHICLLTMHLRHTLALLL